MKRKNSQIKTGIIGCGYIGMELANFLDKSDKFILNTITDIKEENITSLLRKLKHRPFPSDIKNAILQNDLIIESASKEVVKEILESKYIDKKGKKLIVMSTGGIFENLDRVKNLKHVKILIPSGAISGLDAIKASAGEIDYLKITTIKPAANLESAPFVLRNKIMLKNLKRKKVIFEGILQEAVSGFPANINVAASLFLASGFAKLRVKIIADPGSGINKHEIVCKGKFGIMETVTKNLPGENPKTSILAILSALNLLQNIDAKLKIGN